MTVFDGENADIVESLMLQDDPEDGSQSDITFHNILAPTAHPECTSWIDVALSASGQPAASSRTHHCACCTINMPFYSRCTELRMWLLKHFWMWL
jgi:hypothetical protein